MKGLLKNLVLFGAALAGFALALEGGVRVLRPQEVPFAGVFEEDARVGHRYRPGLDKPMPGERPVHVRTNSRGYRDREYDWASSQPFRILGLGDSFTFGYGVAEDETYLARIEAALRDRGIEVVNAGVAGMGTENEERLLAVDGPGLHPDLVLVGFFAGNDLSDVLTGFRRLRLEHGFPVAPPGFVERWYRPLRPGRILDQPLARSDESLGLPIPFKDFLRFHSHAYRFLGAQIDQVRRARRGEAGARQVWESTPLDQHAFCLKSYPPEFEEAWARTQDLFGKMKAWCDAHDARLAIVVIPAQAQVDPQAWAETRERHGLRDEDFDLEKPQRLMAGFGSAAEIPVIDLLPALRRARDDGERLYSRPDIHWTARGHAVAAEEILRRLRALGLLPVA